ncbi:unnamed protein product [Notodromas monacha]|uniref:Uncharacterized protein n=1 Tax=Notodromas monacha TaxID=399045 RepID=A0A7R9C128_9CRUS|nr:unnamed protein product [Notodromas monacha]CAG0924067.1 unnamed protein product [Notodromas monacha]
MGGIKSRNVSVENRRIFSSLERLEELELRGSPGLSQTIIESEEMLKDLSNVRSLDLSNNGLKFIGTASFFELLGNLESLDLRRNEWACENESILVLAKELSGNQKHKFLQPMNIKCSSPVEMESKPVAKLAEEATQETSSISAVSISSLIMSKRAENPDDGELLLLLGTSRNPNPDPHPSPEIETKVPFSPSLTRAAASQKLTETFGRGNALTRPEKLAGPLSPDSLFSAREMPANDLALAVVLSCFCGLFLIFAVVLVFLKKSGSRMDRDGAKQAILAAPGDYESQNSEADLRTQFRFSSISSSPEEYTTITNKLTNSDLLTQQTTLLTQQNPQQQHQNPHKAFRLFVDCCPTFSYVDDDDFDDDGSSTDSDDETPIGEAGPATVSALCDAVDSGRGYTTTTTTTSMSSSKPRRLKSTTSFYSLRATSATAALLNSTVSSPPLIDHDDVSTHSC